MCAYSQLNYVKIGGDTCRPTATEWDRNYGEIALSYPHVGVSVSISFVVFLYMGKQMFTPSTLHHALSIIYAGAVLHFSALYCVSLSIAIWSKQHCVSCAGTGAWLFKCSLYRRPSQSERPARAGLSCECSGQSEYNGTESVLKLVYFIRRIYIYIVIQVLDCCN